MSDATYWIREAISRMREGGDREGAVKAADEIERLIARGNAWAEEAELWKRTANIAQNEEKSLRHVLMELRIRLHAAGRRPEECYEMSLIDAALQPESQGEAQ